MAGCAVAPKAEVNQTDWRDIKVGGVSLRVELALTTEQQTRGLSGRESLAPGTGMLFKFTQAGKYNFWMNEMKFALDFIWVREGKIIQLNANIPPPLKDFPRPETLQARAPVDAVIEVPSGWIKDNGIKIGDEVIGF